MQELLEAALTQKSSKTATVGGEPVSPRRNLKAYTFKGKGMIDFPSSKKERYATKADHQVEQSRSSASKKYNPNRKSYHDTEAYMKDVAVKAVKDMLNAKGKKI